MSLGAKVRFFLFFIVLMLGLSAIAVSGASAVTDTQAPILTDHGPSGAAAGTLFYTSAMVSVAFTEPAPSGGYGTASITVNGGAPQSCNVTTYWWPALDGWITCNLTNLPIGPIDYTVSMADNAGNTSSVSGHFIVDPMQIDIKDDATGGDCGRIGTWDSASKTCTMDRDLDWKTISILSDGITLDGNGHTMYGYRADVAGPPDVYTNLSGGVSIVQKTGVTVKNLTLAYFQTGIYLSYSNGNMLLNNTIYGTGTIDINAIPDAGEGGNIGQGIIIDRSINNEVRGNSLNGSDYVSGTGSWVRGIWVSSANDNNITNNQVSGFHVDVDIWDSCGNSVSDNLLQNSGSYGLIFTGSRACGAAPNTVWHNRFSNNAYAHISSYQAGNIFNLPAPEGGNYYSDWNTPDADADGFVDLPYVFTGGQDDLPLSDLNTHGCGKPALDMGSPRPFWASFADYLAREVTVSFLVRNQGSTFASGVQLDTNTNTEGVATLTSLPRAIGSVAPGGMVSTDLRYQIPAGVTLWTTYFTASAQDDCGATYMYP